jgi:hypothetical protein
MLETGMVLSLLVRWTSVCLALGWALCGCPGGDSHEGSDRSGGGPRPAPGSGAPAAGSLKLELLTKPWVELNFDQRETISVQLVDSESLEPVAGARVSFALVGRSQDSSLSQVDVVTGEDGVAENDLIAGEMAAAFSVRISAAGAYEITVAAGVSSAGFGTLSVTAPYGGPRAVLRRMVFAQAGMSCARAERMQGDPMVTLGQSADAARFAALPAQVSYALLALAEGEGGQILARGCTDGVVVRADRQVTAVVAFEDEPLLLSGEFILDALLDARAPSNTLGATIRNAAATLVETAAGGDHAPARADARFLLDSLYGTLRGTEYSGQAGAIELADAIAQARMAQDADSPEHTLDAALEANREGARRAAIPRLVSFTTSDVSRLRLLAELHVGEGEDELEIEWRPRSLATQPESGDPVSVDLSTLEPVSAPATLLPEHDAVEFARVRIAAPLGALGAQVLHRVVSSDASGRRAELRAAIGCATLSAWLVEQSYAGEGPCGEGCVNAACDRAVTLLVNAAETALTALDQARPTLAVYGELALGDDDGDLLAEHMSTDALLCEWESADSDASGDAFSGTATATAMTMAAARFVP